MVRHEHSFSILNSLRSNGSFYPGYGRFLSMGRRRGSLLASGHHRLGVSGYGERLYSQRDGQAVALGLLSIPRGFRTAKRPRTPREWTVN